MKIYIFSFFILLGSINTAISQPKLELNLLTPNEKFNTSLIDTMTKAIIGSPGFIVIRIMNNLPKFYNPTNDSNSFAMVICTIKREGLADWHYLLRGESSGYFPYKKDTVMVYGKGNVEYFFSKFGPKKRFDLLREPNRSEFGPAQYNTAFYIFSKGTYKLIYPYKRPSIISSQTIATDKSIQKSVVINAPVEKVWEAITNSEQIKKWWSDSTIEVDHSWEKETKLTLYGSWNGVLYKDKGDVLSYEKDKLLKFNYLSQSSKLSDVAKNHTIIEFSLIFSEGKTMLQLIQSGFMTDVSYQHWMFYWTKTLDTLKNFVEQ